MPDSQKILIVEDDLDLAEMLTAYFRMQGYEVLTAAWGEDALQVTREALPDVVLLDIRLPDIDGFEVCRQLRRHRRTGNLPVIFLTEKRDRADRLQGLELGAVDYITKPFDVQELRLRVRNALERAAQATLVNPITNLPEGSLVDERLAELLDGLDWGLLVVTVSGLDAFREAYGFVASDDVLRAVALMLTEVVREDGPGGFVGHLSADDFVIVTDEARLDNLRRRIETKFGHSMDYFYPQQDRDASQRANGLQLRLGAMSAGTSLATDLNGLKTAALRSRTP